MSEKVIAGFLAALLGLGSLATNAIAFSAFNAIFNVGFLNPLAPQNPNSSKSDEKSEPTVVDSRDLGQGVVPDLVGLTVSDAFQLRTLSGFDFAFYEEGQYGFLVDMELSKQSSKNIFVCKQALPAGAEFTPNEAPNMIQVVVSSECEGRLNPFLVGKAKASPSAWEPIRPTEETKNVIQGWVYGFEGEDEDVKVVEVLTYSGIKIVDLAMIGLVGAGGCGIEDTDWEKYKSSALDSKHANLPIGKPVSAVLDWLTGNETDAFFHLLDSNTGEYVQQPPAGSVNEALVKEGLWIPDDEHVKLGPEYVAEKKQKWVGSDGYQELTNLGKSYRKVLLASANKMRKQPKEVLATCIAYETKSFIDVYGSVDVRWKYGVAGGDAPSGCTYVNPYYRRGHIVSGYWRC